ncbi:LWXIA domain-containing protein [Burkholderia cenocepacia]|uniref:LWXIA domain-containing protein n=1 Tax=Burkholderia cenocepacia TaxID=95486 RepID=UPI002B242AE5|nr:LWXIA domain-containing protein [Burkholderia cenocepacia]MEB2496023.1 LWXIA domain-containing protein [Burkholderia cenocepacia]MEB2553778.1 LWXIA domain-containing protein [Burkholderia cenocepacia]
MLDIDGVGMGANWMAFLERTLEAERAKAASQAAQQSGDPSKQQTATPPPPPITVQVTPDTDPSKPTNAEIASATSLIRSLAEQYRPKPPDITVDDPLTQAAQTAIQGAQTQYDNALQDEQDKQTALTHAKNDPSTTKDALASAQTAYDNAHQATAKAEKELDVTTDAGYMIAYAQQADHDNEALDPKRAGSAQADANAALDRLKAAVPGIDDPAKVSPRDDWTPQQKQAYDAWQKADAKLSEAKALHNADIANSNLAFAQLQSYGSNGDYADAMDAGIARINKQLAPLDRVIDVPPALKPDEARTQLTQSADDANYANACLNAATDAAKVADIQGTYNAVSGKYGPTVMSTTVAAQQDLLNHAQASARVSGGYLQMLYANRQVDEQQKNYDATQKSATQWRRDHPGVKLMDPRADLGVEDAATQLWKAKDAASLAHDGYVAAYGNALAIHYDDIAAGVQNRYDHRTMCIANDPTPLEIKGLKTIASALHQADERMTASVNERATKQALADAQAKQQDLKIKVDGLQAQYDQWNRDHGIGPTPSVFSIATPQGTPKNIPLTAPVPFVVNQYAKPLADALAELDQANRDVQHAQLRSETFHQQVLFNEFDAHLDERLRNPKTESDQKDYAKALSDFFGAHRSELSQSLLDKAGDATRRGTRIDFGLLDPTEQRNLVGVAIGLSPDRATGDPHAAQFSDGKKLASIDKVRDELLKVGGGKGTRVNVMPIVYASKDAGLVTSAIFKVTNENGDTHYVDDQGAKYSSIDNFIDDNSLSSDGTLDIATGYDANGTARIDPHNTAHDDSWWESVMHTFGSGDVNLGMLLGGIALEVGGGLLDATVFGAPLGVALNVAGTGLIYTSAAAAVANSGYDLANRIQHDRTISPLDAEARADYLNLVPAGVGGVGKIATLLNDSKGLATFVRRATTVTGLGGAAEAGVQFVHDAVTGHTDRLAGDASSFILNLGLAQGHQKLKAVTTGIVRRTGGFGGRDLNNQAVQIGDQTVRIGQSRYTATNTLRLGRTRATIDGRSVTVAGDGTLMVGKRVLTYEGVPIRVLSRANAVNTGARGKTGTTAFVDHEGRITIAERVDGSWRTLERTRFNRYGTDGRITAGRDGSLTLSDGIELRAPSQVGTPRGAGPAPATPTAAPPHDDGARTNAARATPSTLRAAADPTAAVAEPAAATSRATAQAGRSSAQVRERAAENDQDARTASRADRRSGDARTIQYRRVADPAETGAGGPLEPLTFRQRVAWTVLHAIESSPLAPGFAAREADVAVAPGGPRVEQHSYGGRTLFVVRNGRPDAPLTRPDGTPLSGHELALDARHGLPAPSRLDEPIVLVAEGAEAGLAPELANVWNRPVFVAPRGALAADGTIRATSGFLRFDPAPHPEVALGPLRADGLQVFHADSGKPVDLNEHLGALLGFGAHKGGFALGRDAVVALYEDFSTRAEQQASAGAERAALALLRRRYDLPTVAMDGPFSHAGRVAVLYQPRGGLHTGDAGRGLLPTTLDPESLQTLRTLRDAIQQDRLYFDPQGVYRDGRLLLADPGPIETHSDAYRQTLADVDDQITLLERGIERGDVKLKRPDVQMRAGGAPLPNQVSAFAEQSGTLAQQMRLLGSDRSRVNAAGKRPGGGRYTRKALEAEASRQLNAFEARYDVDLGSRADAHPRDAGDPPNDHGGRDKPRDDAPRSMREIQAQRVAWSRAHVERNASPFGAATPALDALGLRRRGLVSMDEADRLAIVHADTQPDGTLLGPDGRPIDPHGFSLLSDAPYAGQRVVILAARHANEGAAAQLANLWQRPVYAVHPDAVGADGGLTDLSGMNRYVPAAYEQPALGELSVTGGQLHVAGDPARTVDPADHLGPLVGSGLYKTVFDGGTGQAIGFFRDTSPDGVEVAHEEIGAEQGGLRELKRLDLPVSTVDGPFSHLGRVGVVYKPAALLSSAAMEKGLGLPGVVRRSGLDDLANIRNVTQRHGLLYDFQVLFGRHGEVLLHDPGQVLHKADPEGDVVERIDGVIDTIQRGIATGRIRLAHPAYAESGAYAQRPGMLGRVVQRFRGRVLLMRAHAIARQSPTFRAQMRLARSDGWTIRVGTPGGGHYADADTRTIVLDGNTRRAGTLVFVWGHELQHSVDLATGALAAEHASPEAAVAALLKSDARAEVNAYTIRNEILAAGGPDIATHATLPDALARATEHALTSRDPAALDALADTFGDMRTSTPGNPTYREYYGEQVRAAAGRPVAARLAAPARARHAVDGHAMKHARAWLDARDMRTLTRAEGQHAPTLGHLVQQTGTDTALLIARAGQPTPDAPPTFVATAHVDANGAIQRLRFLGNALNAEERQALKQALSSAMERSDPAGTAAARRAFDFHASPVTHRERVALGGPAKVKPAREGETVEFTRNGRVRDAYVDAIDALSNAPHFARAKQAVAAAGHADTIYVVDKATGKIAGHARYDSATGVWQYRENAPHARTHVTERPLAAAYPQRGRIRLRPNGKLHGVPLTRARTRGMTFFVSSVEPATLARVGDRFDAPRPPKKDKTEVLPRRGLHYGGHVAISGMHGLRRRFASLTGTGAAIALRRARAIATLGRASPATRPLPAGGTRTPATTALAPAPRAFEAGLLPAASGHALDFSGHNVVHLLSLAKARGLVPGKHFIYVYGGGERIAYRLGKPRAVITANAQGELTWHDNWRKPDSPGVPLDASPIGGGPYGGDTHLLLTELAPDALAEHARGTRLKTLETRLATVDAWAKDPSPDMSDARRDWGATEARRLRSQRHAALQSIRRANAAAARNGQAASGHPVLDVRTYQPSLVSTTQVESLQRYGDGNASALLAHYDRIDALVQHARDPRAAPLELDDAVNGVPPAIMADAQALRDTGMPLYVARDWSGGGSRYAPIPLRRKVLSRFSTALATDRALRRRLLAADPAYQQRVVPMSRAFRLSDDPAKFVAQIERHGGVMPAVTIVIDPHTLAATRGAKHDPAVVHDAKSIGDHKDATIDYWTGTITGANGKSMRIDDLAEQYVHNWLDASSKAGFLLRFEMAPARALVSSVDHRHQPGSNTGYHDHARLGALLESWNRTHLGQPAPHVMVTFHGWDTVPEPASGASHLELAKSLLDHPALPWVHVGLSYATHGSDFVANQELTTALATLLVERARANDPTLARLHGADALTRVYDRVDRTTLMNQHGLLLAEVDRIGRARGMSPARLAALRQQLYEGNTTQLLHRARYATSRFAADRWAADPRRAPAASDAARMFTERWLTDVGARLAAPEQIVTTDGGGAGVEPLQAWRETVIAPALVAADTQPISESRLVSAQTNEPMRPDDPLAAAAELHALRLHQPDSWIAALLNRKNLLSIAIGAGAGFAVHHFGLTPDKFKQAANAAFVGVRTGRLVQAVHQDTVRALQSGDPRLFDRVIDRFVDGLNNQLDAHQMHAEQRNASLILLAESARAKIHLQLELHKAASLPADKTLEYTKMIANDMLQQMQGVLAGTSIQQLHYGNPRRFMGKAGRAAAIAGYASLGELSLHALLQNPSVVPALGAAGALLGITYTGLVQGSAFAHLSIERRSRVVRGIDLMSDLASIAGGAIAPFVGPHPAIQSDLPIAISSLSSATLLALARIDTHFPNLPKRLTGSIPTSLMVAPILIYVGKWIYTAFEDDDGKAPPSGTQQPGGGATQHAVAPSSAATPGHPAPATHAAQPSAPPSPSASAASPSRPQPSPGTPSNPPSPSNAPQPYIVVDGDSLWVIADQHRQSLLDAAHVSRADQQAMTRGEQDARALKEILQLNPSAARDATHLPVGTPLVVG